MCPKFTTKGPTFPYTRDTSTTRGVGLLSLKTPLHMQTLQYVIRIDIVSRAGLCEFLLPTLDYSYKSLHSGQLRAILCQSSTDIASQYYENKSLTLK